MPLYWRPVGPEPASTYWQRRAVFALGAVLLLALLTWLLTRGGDDSDSLAQAPAPSAAPTASSSPSASVTASPTTSATPAATACAADALEVEASADADSYRVGASPRLSLSVKNTGAAACTVDLGQANVELVVFSGDDRIWSSDDCASGGGRAVTMLQPGKGQVQRVTWNGRRSQPGCKGEKARAQAGTYRVSGRVGQLRTEGEVFRFTD